MELDEAKELIETLDDMVRDMDTHNWMESSEVYGGLTYRNIIEIELQLISGFGLNVSNYYVGSIYRQEKD